MTGVTIDFDVFFREQQPRLFASMVLVTGSRQDADELSQEAFVRVLERWDRVGAMEDPVGFLFRTAMNLFRSRYRREQIARRLRVVPPHEDDAFSTIDDRDVLIRALRELTPRQRAAVVLTTVLGYPSDEAGRMLGISDSTVRVLAGRARAILKATVGGDA
jgi:RNA polymerase sigma-70 factor, ECF subfamily